MKQTLLASLAFLKVNSDANNEMFLDNFIPFIVHSISKLPDDVISTSALQQIVFEEFGLRIPQSVIAALLYRAKRKGGYVRISDKVFYKVKENLAGFVFSAVQEQVQRIYSALVADFVGYSKTKFSVDFSPEDAEKAMLSFINYNQPYFYKTQADDIVVPISRTSSEDIKFIVANYIYEARLSKPEVYEYLDTVVKGYMITNVLYLPDVHDTKKKFNKTKIFLDTSFIIHALGYNGSEIQLPRLELLELLYKNNAKICCFTHTVEEIEGILEACSNNLKATSPDTPFGRSVRYFVSMGYTPSDIKLLVSHLKTNIQKLRIEIVPTPGYENHSYVMDEAGLFKYLKENIIYSREDAIHKDVASISAIYRLRKNNYSNYLENSKAVFVTTNNTLTSVSNDFFYRGNDKDIAPPCVTDFLLTNLLWLKTPNQAPDLPMKKIIADSYAAIQPDERMMAKWFSEIKKLENMDSLTVEDYYFIRSSDEVYLALMEVTKGNIDAVTSGTVPQILERAREIVRHETEIKYQEEMNKRVESESLLAAQRAEVRKNEELRRVNVSDRARSIAVGIMKFVRAFVILFLVFGVVVTFPLNLIASEELVDNILSNFSKFSLSLVLLIMLIVGVINQYAGTAVNSCLNALEISIEKRLFKMLWSISN